MEIVIISDDIYFSCGCKEILQEKGFYCINITREQIISQSYLNKNDEHNIFIVDIKSTKDIGGYFF